MAETAPVYESLEQAPESWRQLQGARLNLEQLNAIMDRAYELGKGGKPAYGEAHTEFMDRHQQRDGQWVRKPTN